MAKPQEPPSSSSPSSYSWGTLEELLLACAVNRYGTDCWDSIATEIQKRTTTTTTSSSSSTLQSFTPETCQQKYHDLKRRFSSAAADLLLYHPPPPETDRISSPKAAASASDSDLWLDELRKLRIAELRRELERYDLSIVSLQSEVKKLKEEREQSLREKSRGHSDLDRNPVEEEKHDRQNTPETSPPGAGSGKDVSVSGDGENQSVNESNSTDPKADDVEERVEGTGKEPACQVDGEADAVEGRGRAAGEVSDNGSSDTVGVAATLVAEGETLEDLDSVKGDRPGKESTESTESVESVAESEGGEEEAVWVEVKESSDVQSSASLSRKLRPEKVVYGSNSGEVVETGNQSSAVQSADGKSQPLIDFLEAIRTHEVCSIFEHRLPGQASLRYKNLIRQHVDIQTIRTRLEAGDYDSSVDKFRRDLLLIINNAVLFFPCQSSEHGAALELRQLVANHCPCSTSAATTTPEKFPEEAVEHLLLLKRKLSGGPVIACRKRSSIIAKGDYNKKKDTGETVEAAKQQQQPVEKVPLVTKKRSRDQKNAGKNTKSRSSSYNNNIPNSSNKDVDDSQPSSSSPGTATLPRGSENENSDGHGHGHGNATTTTITSSKKQGASNFLNRMLRSSSNNNRSPLLDLLKNNDGAAGEQKGKGGGGGGGRSKGGSREQQSSRRGSSGRKQVKEKEKKGNNRRGGGGGRVSAAAKIGFEGKPPPPTKVAKVVPAASAAGKKRRRESGGVDDAVAKKRQRK